MEPEGEEAPLVAVAAPPLPLPDLVATALLPAPPVAAPDPAADVTLPLPVAEATGVVIVQGQFVIVRVCDAVAVYVWPLLTRVVAWGQYVV